MNFNNFRDYNYINALIFNTLPIVPKDIDLIVGIPRSGMIIANIIGEFINKPVISIWELNQNIQYRKFNNGSFTPLPKEIKKILLVDDAVGYGITMDNAVNFIKEKNNFEIVRFVVFTEEYGKSKTDIYCSVLKDQFMPFSTLKRACDVGCFDIDGVLCEDVPDSENDDGERYIKFISNSRQMFVPDRPIHTLVSGRLEKYRAVTEDWLKRHGIQYKHLILLNLPNNFERAKINVGDYKADVYNKSGCSVFIESDPREATAIRTRTGKPVFCTKIQNMIP